MAKQWVRNYDNIFCAVYGCNELATGGVTNPTFEVPHIRHTDGLYYPIHMTHISYNVFLAHGLSIPAPTKYGISTGSSIGGTSNTAVTNSSSIVLGGGGTTPSYDDYYLEEPYTSDLTLGTVSTSQSYDEDTHIYTKTYKVPVLYSGEEDITVREFGIFIYVPARTAGKGTSTMLYRETLAYPITLSQNDTLEISFSQSIMQPNYTPYPVVE